MEQSSRAELIIYYITKLLEYIKIQSKLETALQSAATQNQKAN